MFKKLIIPTLMIVALIGAACGKKDNITSSSSIAKVTAGTVEAPLSGTVTLTIKDFAYVPSAIVIKKGTVVTITNQDIASHTVTADDGSFDSKTISRDESASLTMTTAGVFKIHCRPHPQITGLITVID